jgi:hypothetical protein
MRLLVLSSLLLAACSPYSPDLGAAPFRCGPADQDKRCPDGYTCIPGQGSDAAEVCVENGGNGMIPDVNLGNCANDTSLEPNDSTATAWVSPVDNNKDFELASLAICPPGDKDTYQVMIQTANENLEVNLEYEDGGADLQASILNSGGVPIANATSTGANTKRAYTANLPIAVYYVQVTGPTSGSVTTNNYKLHFVVSGP